jgi:SIR2-like domain
LAQFFVIDGDIKRLWCDAWLLPTDSAFTFTPAFIGGGGPSYEEARTAIGPWNGQLVQPCGSRQADRPWPWFGNIGMVELDELTSRARDELEAVVDEFFDRAATELGDIRSHQRRPRLAINVLGTGAGGTAAIKGATTRALVDVVPALARRHDADAVLVTWGAKPYTAAQTYRRAVTSAGDGVSTDRWELGPARRRDELLAEARRLADLVKRESLVLFLGAGVSMAAGAPAWETLIRSLARDIDLSDFDIDDAIRQADLRDIATVLARAYGNDDDFRTAVKRHVERGHYSLLHGLLASLRLREAVTTNYDALYELAATTAGRSLGVLPGSASIDPGIPWLLKLHGSMDSEPVLTRADYAGASVRHAALFGLVQALLVTRHMLFVGYSLRDEDFHQVVHDVRLAMPKQTFGTALVLVEDPFQRRLWRTDLDLVHMVDVEEAEELGDDSIVQAVAARRLEVFLDLLGVLSVRDYPYALDPTYGDSANPHGALEVLQNIDIATLAREGPEGRLRRLLGELGHPEYTED